jgi:hypothetical protein
LLVLNPTKTHLNHHENPIKTTIKFFPAPGCNLRLQEELREAQQAPPPKTQAPMRQGRLMGFWMEFDAIEPYIYPSKKMV